MLKSKKENNKINLIIKDYIDNDRFTSRYELKRIRKKISYMIDKGGYLYLIVSLDENKLKFISPHKIDYYKRKSTGNNFIHLGDYNFNDFENDFFKFYYTIKNNNNEDILISFLKSSFFKDRLLEIFSSYNIYKLNGGFNSGFDLANIRITLNESNLEQKIYAYYYKLILYNSPQNTKWLKDSIDKELLYKTRAEKINIKESILNYYCSLSIKSSLKTAFKKFIDGFIFKDILK